MKIKYEWNTGTCEVFEEFYKITEEYYSRIVGGVNNRKSFIPHNMSIDIKDVLIAYDETGAPVGCVGLKEYSKTDAEIKRLWVQPAYRKNHIAHEMMQQIEEFAKEKGYKRTILQTREIMTAAVGLYKQLNYIQVHNYPPYDKLDTAICFAKELN